MILTRNLLIAFLICLFAAVKAFSGSNSPSQTTIPSLVFGSNDSLLLHFGFVQPGSWNVQSFQFTGQNLLSTLILTAPEGFELSKNNSTFSASLSYTVAEAGTANRVWIRFRPLQPNKGYGGSISFSSTGLSVSRPDVSGSSLPPSLSLDVVSWNLAWFGATGNGPTDEDRQQFYASVVMDSLDADIYILQEIVDTSRLGALTRSLKNGPYAYVVAPYASGTTTNTNGTWRSAQKLAYIYRTQLFSISTARGYTNTSTHPDNYFNWASGRFPFLLDALVTVDGITKRIAFLNLHAKAESGLVSDYERRKGAALLLYDSVKVTFPTQHVLIAGDYNDDLDQTISSAVPGSPTPYLSFMNDALNFSPVSYWNTLRGDNSYIGFPNVIDHSIVSNEMQQDYVPFSCILRKDALKWVPFYRSDLTDHYPLQSRYFFRQSQINQVTSVQNPVVQNRFAELLGIGSPAPVVRFTKNLAGPLTVRLFTAAGQLLWHHQLTGVRSGQLLQLPTTSSAAGLRMLTISGREGTFTTKLY
jgi:trimeric autotransporter adhesin